MYPFPDVHFAYLRFNDRCRWWRRNVFTHARRRLFDDDQQRRARRLADVVLAHDAEATGIFIEHFRYVQRIDVTGARYLIVRTDNRLVIEQPVDLGLRCPDDLDL